MDRPPPQDNDLLITHDMIMSASIQLGRTLQGLFHDRKSEISIWGIPRGGVCSAYALMAYASRFCDLDLRHAYCTEEANVIIDDLVDTGATRKKCEDEYGRYKPFAVLFDKSQPNPTWMTGIHLPSNVGWLVFPWEVNDGK